MCNDVPPTIDDKMISPYKANKYFSSVGLIREDINRIYSHRKCGFD